MRFRGNPLLALLGTGFLVCFGLWALCFSAIPAYLNARKLVASGRPIVAQITGVYDKSRSHGRYAVYRFAVNRQSYTGRADYYGDYGDRGPLNVTYLPEDPSISAVDPPETLLNKQTGVGLIFLYDLMFFVIFLTIRGRWLQFRR